jgi:succinate dehydrogenase/fumarate reductase-like Fe-S protein
MPRLFMIFLIVLMPLQLSWAAMASYCQHETGAAAKAADGKEKAPDPAKTGGNDLDCASCHASCPSILHENLTPPPILSSSLLIADHWARLTSPSFQRLERPKWRVLA